jgi:hypothetical protein
MNIATLLDERAKIGDPVKSAVSRLKMEYSGRKKFMEGLRKCKA